MKKDLLEEIKDRCVRHLTNEELDQLFRKPAVRKKLWPKKKSKNKK